MRSAPGSEPARVLPRVGRYEILLELQDEGFVARMAARVRGPNAGPRLVELAKVEHVLALEAEVREAYLAEARAAAKVRHTHFVHPTDTVVQETDLFCATELVLGARLDELVRAALVDEYEIPLKVSLRILFDVLAGLSALHASGANAQGSRPIVHGDVAPTNIVVSYRGEARIVHSGLSLATARVGALAQRNMRLPYKAPEQLRTGVNAVPIAPAADVFAVGVLLWETLEQARLFEAPTDVDAVEKIVHGAIPAISSARARNVPVELLLLAAAALEKEPNLRIAHAAEFGAALQKAPGVELASAEEVALVVDRLMGPLIERRRDQLDQLIAQADEGRPSDKAIFITPMIPSRTSPPASGLIFPPTARHPSSQHLLPAARYGAWSNKTPSQPKLAAAVPVSSPIGPISSLAPSTPRPSTQSALFATKRRPDKGPPSSDPAPPRSPVGWAYYIALGACVGTLVFMLVNGPGRHAATVQEPPQVSLPPPTESTDPASARPATSAAPDESASGAEFPEPPIVPQAARPASVPAPSSSTFRPAAPRTERVAPSAVRPLAKPPKPAKPDPSDIPSEI